VVIKINQSKDCPPHCFLSYKHHSVMKIVLFGHVLDMFSTLQTSFRNEKLSICTCFDFTNISFWNGISSKFFSWNKIPSWWFLDFAHVLGQDSFALNVSYIVYWVGLPTRWLLRWCWC
jgi:hypothetical protein